MKVKLHRRHGHRPAGGTHEYRDTIGQWLIEHGFGEAVEDETAKPKPPRQSRKTATTSTSTEATTASD